MPLTPFQQSIARLLAQNRSEQSHLAGGAALHLSPRSQRFSNDLDFFHDSVERVAEAFSKDRVLLEGNGFRVEVLMNQIGFIRALVAKENETTKIEWSHDSAWRFMPVEINEVVGFQLHPVDVAVNKLLALAGRDEARDFLDVLYIDEHILPLGALCWAAVGKDPGFTPLSLLELVRRRGKYRPEDFSRLRLAQPIDLTVLKSRWLVALDRAEQFIRSRPLNETGCLYYSTDKKCFIAPSKEDSAIPHFGTPGGVLPEFYEQKG